MPLGLVFIQLHVTLHLHHLEEAKNQHQLGHSPSGSPRPALLLVSKHDFRIPT